MSRFSYKDATYEDWAVGQDFTKPYPKRIQNEHARNEWAPLSVLRGHASADEKSISSHKNVISADEMLKLKNFAEWSYRNGFTLNSREKVAYIRFNKSNGAHVSHNTIRTILKSRSQEDDKIRKDFLTYLRKEYRPPNTYIKDRSIILLKSEQNDYSDKDLWDAYRLEKETYVYDFEGE